MKINKKYSTYKRRSFKKKYKNLRVNKIKDNKHEKCVIYTMISMWKYSGDVHSWWRCCTLRNDDGRQCPVYVKWCLGSPWATSDKLLVCLRDRGQFIFIYLVSPCYCSIVPFNDDYKATIVKQWTTNTTRREFSSEYLVVIQKWRNSWRTTWLQQELINTTFI